MVPSRGEKGIISLLFTSHWAVSTLDPGTEQPREGELSPLQKLLKTVSRFKDWGRGGFVKNITEELDAKIHFAAGCCHIECSTFTTSSFRIWNGSLEFHHKCNQLELQTSWRLRLISQDIATNLEVWVVYKTSLLALILIRIALSNWILSAFLVDCEGGRNIFFLFCWNLFHQQWVGFTVARTSAGTSVITEEGREKQV